MFPTIITGIMIPIMLFAQPSFGSGTESKTLASHVYSLANRYPDESVNTVFKDNILLTLNYLADKKINKTHINWSDIEKPRTYTLSLKPGETFAFHDDVLPEYNSKVAKTTNTHFNWDEGFKSDGYLVGDGVCHLASLLYWTAKDAGLDAVAPTRHDFAPVPDVPAEYGTSIFDNPQTPGLTNEEQNLYITNNLDTPITFVFKYDGTFLTTEIDK